MVGTLIGDRCSMSVSADSPSDETLNRGPLALLLRRQYEFPFGIILVQFSFFFQSGMLVCFFPLFHTGLKALNVLTNERKMKLRIELSYESGQNVFALYNQFIIGDVSTKYEITTYGYSGDAGKQKKNESV